MKRISKSRQDRFSRLSRKRWRHRLTRKSKQKRLGRRFVGSAKSPELKLIAPKDFSFTTNYSETVEFLRNLKGAVLVPPTKKRRIFIDLAEIRQITLAGALILAAEIHRWREYSGVGLVARNPESWDPEVRRLLVSIGFFRLLKVNVESDQTYTPIPNHVTVLPMVSSTSLDQELLHEIQAHLTNAARVLKQDPLVYAALVEAAYNAKLHAYPPSFEYEFPPVIKGWWATAGWLPSAGCVKFLVYDQGVGIPSTLPRWSGWEKIRAAMKGLFGDGAGQAMKDASNLIEAAIRLDRTSLDGGHGKGLQDIVTVVDNVPGSSVRILSGTGRVLYRNGGRTEKKDEALHIGGTLIEWTIPVGTHDGR